MIILKYSLLLFLVALLPTGFAETSMQLNPKFGTVIGQCKGAATSSRHVWVFKQWHLSPSLNTKSGANTQNHPQEKNQTAIYRQLDEWIGKKLLKEIYAEGCAGELNSSSTINYNGWTIDDLKNASARPDYPQIITNVPLKIEAKYDAGVRTMCGDDPELVKENNLAFSDARGTLGFLSRIEQYKKDPRRVKTYMDGAIELYKLPPSASIAQVTAKLKTELKEALTRTNNALERRNKKLVELVKASAQPEVAIVYGGLHASGITRLLEEAGIACSVVEPTGYQDDEVKLMKQLDGAVKSL